MKAKLLAAAIFCSLALRLAGAQNSPPEPSQSKSPAASSQEPQPKPEAPVSEKTKEQEEKQERSKRVLGVLPQFGVTNIRDARPLRPSEKFRLFARSAFDPVEFGIVGIQAGISQATNGFPAYGQGAEGYGKRYGAAFADQVSAGLFGNFVYPTLLKQDPRYFRMGEGSFGKRALNGISQVFVAHADRGGRQFNFSAVMGAFTAGGISNAYYPDDDRGVGLTLSRAAIALGYGMAGGVFDEFWPDINKKLFHKKKK